MNYKEFLESKLTLQEDIGFEADNLPDKLFNFQKAIIKWAIKKGKAAIFADTGMGKTFM